MPAAVVAPQIVFLTLFLGLVSGRLPVELLVEGSIARLELSVDGRAVETLTAAPWRSTIDFGPELRPAEILAQGFDAEGRRLAEARQWVNLARPPAEIDVLIERDAEGRPVAVRPVWGALVAGHRPQLALELDGERLALGADGRARLPALDLRVAHLLAAEIRFSSGVVARRDLVVGGEWADSAGAELTALAFLPPERSRTVRTAASVASRLESAGVAPRGVALEDGGAQVILVRGASAEAGAARVGGVGQRPIKRPMTMAGPGFDAGDPGFARFDLRLEPEDRIRFLWPSGTKIPGASLPTRLFDFSRDFTSRDGGLLWLLTSVSFPDKTDEPARLADAVAVAGLQAVASHRRRAVVLVLGDETEDPSYYSPVAVRRYLDLLRVPLEVWALGDSPLARLWGPVERIRRAADLRPAVRILAQGLDRQKILWIEGSSSPSHWDWNETGRSEGFRWPTGGPLAGESTAPRR